jgi:hypothetical protein
MSLYRLSIVLAINGIYTKPRIFGHRPVCRLSIISPIVISKLSFASVYGTICTKSVVIAHKNSYKQPLYFGIPGVLVLQTPVTADIVPIANLHNIFSPHLN